MDNIINNFRIYNEKLKKSKRTIEDYNEYVKKFVREYSITIDNINQLEDKGFVESWLDDQLNNKYSANTINHYKDILSVFSSYLIFNDIISVNKFKELESVKNDKVKVDVYSKEDIEAIFSYMENKINKNNFKRKIDKKVYVVNMTAIKLLYKNAMRISEVCSIEINDFDLNEGSKFYIHGKGGNGKITRFNSFSNDMMDLINECFEIRSDIEIKEGNEKYFFISPISKSKITEASLRKFLKNILHELNIEYSSPAHDMRHSKLSELVNKGIEISKVANFAGHKSSRTTEAYYVHGDEKIMDDLVNM